MSFLVKCSMKKKVIIQVHTFCEKNHGGCIHSFNEYACYVSTFIAGDILVNKTKIPATKELIF